MAHSQEPVRGRGSRLTPRNGLMRHTDLPPRSHAQGDEAVTCSTPIRITLRDHLHSRCIVLGYEEGIQMVRLWMAGFICPVLRAIRVCHETG